MKAFIIAVISIGFILLPYSTFAQHDAGAVPAPAVKLSAEQWRADIRFLGDELAKRHGNAFARIKKEDYDAAVKSLYDGAPRMNEDEIIVGMMKIVAMVRDGHTSLIARPYFRSGIFPVKYYWFSDGLYIVSATPEYADLVGAKVVRIGNMSTEDALKAAGAANASDNEMGTRNYAPVLIKVPEILAGLKIADDKNKLTLRVESNGKSRTVEIRPTASADTLMQAPKSWVELGGNSALPLYRKNPGELYWSEYLKDKKILYIQHNGIANKEGEPVAEFYKKVLESADANAAEKLVMDIRFNGGGNNTLNVDVIKHLMRSKLNRRGSFFVIIGRDTFSAAQNLVNQLEKYTDATFVGEPTAAHPNHYGDNRPFELPNSHLTVRASTLYWQDLDPRDSRYWTAPEIAAELSSEDYRLGRDPAFRAVLDYSVSESFPQILAEAQRTGDVNGFVTKYRAFKADPKHRFEDTEAPINRAGYWLLERKRVQEAIDLFKLNAEYYPKSANVYDSLGDAYAAAGNKEEAIKAYSKALAIDPTYPSSLDALKRLRSQ
jgi:tetratricopeptide (TPR) repeat protein